MVNMCNRDDVQDEGVPNGMVKEANVAIRMVSVKKEPIFDYLPENLDIRSRLIEILTLEAAFAVLRRKSDFRRRFLTI